MKLVTQAALLRLAMLLAVGILVLGAVGWYMTACPQSAGAVTAWSIQPERLRRHVSVLAGEIGERHVGLPQALHRAEQYIRSVWEAQGYTVNRLPYVVNGLEVANLEVARPGSREIVVVGAHYDTVPGSPGANDNASGVAALLELSSAWEAQPGDRTVRFVAFVNEEPPFFQTDQMGSRVYARACRQRGDRIYAMVSLETIAYYSGAAGSQQYPSPLFRLWYPSRGDFLGFVADFRSRTVMHQAAAAYRATGQRVECCATWSGIPGVSWSDHWSFWQEGYRAFMVTDTAPFRYPHYHAPTDTPDQIRYDVLAQVTAALGSALTALARP